MSVLDATIELVKILFFIFLACLLLNCIIFSISTFFYQRKKNKQQKEFFKMLDLLTDQALQETIEELEKESKDKNKEEK